MGNRGHRPESRDDRYLRLLADDSCWAVLQRTVAIERQADHDRVVTGPWRRLDEESAKELQEKKRSFRLHGKAA